MSLDQAIAHGKERRKPYRDARRFDRSCRNHGSCCYCYKGRQRNKRLVRQIQEFEVRDAIGK